MDSPPPYRNTGDGSGPPRWVKVCGVAALVVVALLVVLLLAGGGGHSPGRHAGAQVVPYGVLAATLPRW